MKTKLVYLRCWLTVIGLVSAAVGSVIAAENVSSSSNMQPKATVTYHLPNVTGLKFYGSPARVIEIDGRSGLNFTGIRGRLALPQHTVGLPSGTLTLWMCPLQDLASAVQKPEHAMSNQYFGNYALLTDREAVREFDQANFALCFQSAGAPSTLWAKFSGGSFIQVYDMERPGAMVTTNKIQVRQFKWYQVTLTWDRPAEKFKLYLNGILVGLGDTFAKKLCDDPCGPILYLGNPAIAYSDIAFYDHVIDGQGVASLFRQEATKIDPVLQADLEREQTGIDLPKFTWAPDGEWETRLELSMNRPDDFQQFFVQGYGNGVEVTDEGFHIKTPSMEEANRSTGIGKAWTDIPGKPAMDMTRMYLWTRQSFEGDLYFSMDIKILEHGGLSLLLLQAAGMQGEDFMEDYFLRTNGSMVTVYGEDVRNYSWEYYREMVDIRNDRATHHIGKNPWSKPLDAQVENRAWELNRWYRVEFLQEGAHLRGAIDGVTVLDAMDSGFTGQGPVLHNGHIAVRFMMRTNVLIRNLRVMNRPLFKSHPLQ